MVIKSGLFCKGAKQSGFPRTVPNRDKGLLFIAIFAHKVNFIPIEGHTHRGGVSKNVGNAQTPPEEGMTPTMRIRFTFEQKRAKWVG